MQMPQKEGYNWTSQRDQNVDHELLLELKCRNSIKRKPNKIATD
jgi:hypothetical protein